MVCEHCQKENRSIAKFCKSGRSRRREAAAENRCRYLYLSPFAQGRDECPSEREHHYHW